VRRLIALAVSLGLRAWDIVARRVFRSTASGNGVVLYYHGVKAHQRHRFAQQMDDILRIAKPVRADDPVSTGETRRHVAVTFDDGLRSVVENALPELAKREIPFTVFITSGCLGERPSWVHDPQHPSFDERVLSATELRELATGRLATIGSHSITHPNLAALDSRSAAHELAVSKTQLQDAIGRGVDLFSFPHGAHDEAVVEQARRAGYRRVFTIEPTPLDVGGTSFVVGRVAADPDDWRLEFRLKLAGAYRWRHFVHRLLPRHIRA
jgi:peptidoglycan/xylan/chitin deacetylase (PgdA/CDA1 family)